jgi:hypothetical protein
MPWKLYIDSRKRVPKAGSTDSDFAIQLPYPITVSGKAYVDVVILTNSFYTIRTGENDKVYIDELASQTKRVVTIPPGQYNVFTLKDALVISLNLNRAITGQYSVTYSGSLNRYIIGLVNPTGTDQFRIYMEAELKLYFSLWGVSSVQGLNSANRQLGFLEGSTLDGNSTTSAQGPESPDIQPYKQLFLRSNLGGGSSESLGVNGETDIVRRIVVGNVPVNGVVHDMHAQPLDCVTINGTPEINQLWFQLIDVEGRIVNTHGHPVSFSIIFANLDE